VSVSNNPMAAVRMIYRGYVVVASDTRGRVGLGALRRRAMRHLLAILRAEKAGMLPPRPEPLVRTYTDAMDDADFMAAVEGRRRRKT